MPLGYCAECGRLVQIEARGTVPGRRQQLWYPVKHPRRGDDTGGQECPGGKVPL